MKTGRFTICISCQAGNQRGIKQGDKTKKPICQGAGKISLNQLRKNKISHINLIAQKKTHNLFWVGALLAIFSLSFMINPANAKAASIEPNIEAARQVIGTVAPVISNNLANNHSASLDPAPEGYLNKPLLAETKITQTPKVITRKLTSSKTNIVFAKNSGNHFAYGWCTYYAASRRNVPWFGNAGTWLVGAQKFGFATGSQPQVGAIIVTAESRWGHVGIVESVNGDGTITISEMNYAGFARISSRTISASYGAIKGYIY